MMIKGCCLSGTFFSSDENKNPSSQKTIEYIFFAYAVDKVPASNRL